MFFHLSKVISLGFLCSVLLRESYDDSYSFIFAIWSGYSCRLLLIPVTGFCPALLLRLPETEIKVLSTFAYSVQEIAVKSRIVPHCSGRPSAVTVTISYDLYIYESHRDTGMKITFSVRFKHFKGIWTIWFCLSYHFWKYFHFLRFFNLCFTVRSNSYS